MEKIEIKLGQKVRDVVTGFEGIATAKCAYLCRCVEYEVTPLSTDGKFPDTQYVIHKRLEVTGNGVPLEPDAARDIMDDAPKFKLGQRVRDVASGFEGIAVSRVVYESGDVRYGVTPLCTDGKLANLSGGRLQLWNPSSICSLITRDAGCAFMAKHIRILRSLI